MLARWQFWAVVGAMAALACGETRRAPGSSVPSAGAPQQGGSAGAGAPVVAGSNSVAGSVAMGGSGTATEGGQGPNAGGLGGEAGEAPEAEGGAPPERDATAARWPMPNPAGSGLPNPASYDTSSEGVVLDNVTNLVWQRELEPGPYDFAAAVDYCAELELGGHDDWRLPRRIELVSLIDFTRAQPAIDSDAFPDVPSEFFWTAGVPPLHPDSDFAVEFGVGLTRRLTHDLELAVRCVRASEGDSTPPEPFTTTELTVLDSETGLQWARDFSFKPLLDQEQAKLMCAALTLDGHDDWRMPSMKELQTLVDERYEHPALDRAIFPTATFETTWYETSTAAALPSSVGGLEVWELRFGDGATQTIFASIDGGAQCVR